MLNFVKIINSANSFYFSLIFLTPLARLFIHADCDLVKMLEDYL